MEKYDVSFQIFGTNMNPDSISEQMRLVPDEISVPETVIGTYKGQECISDVGTWSIAGSSETKQTETQIEELLAVLRPRKEVLGELKRLGWEMRFFCGIFTEDAAPGMSLPSEMLVEVGNLGIDIDLAYYFVETNL